jgi:hypothetical protein
MRHSEAPRWRPVFQLFVTLWLIVMNFTLAPLGNEMIRSDLAAHGRPAVGEAAGARAWEGVLAGLFVGRAGW